MYTSNGRPGIITQHSDSSVAEHLFVIAMMGSNLSTLVVTYVCSILAVALIFVRLIWRCFWGERMYADDIWMGISLGPLLIRLGLIHVVLVYGTNNLDSGMFLIQGMSQREKEHRVIGSKMILASRIFYAGFLWCMKICILGFYERLTARTKPYGLLIDITYFTCFITFIAVILSTLLECRPFHVYWQLTPDPGHCVMGIAQLVTMGAFNILTDAILVLLPLPIVLKSRLPLPRKLQLLLLFCLGFFVVSITIIRMPVIVADKSVQKARTLWASIECLAACVVANAPILNAFIQKARKHPSNHDQYNLSPNSGPRRMPVTGQDSRGSLTRGDRPTSAMIETRTEVVQKVDLDPGVSVVRTKTKKSPWRGDFLGTQIWTENEQQLCIFPTRPSPVAFMTKSSRSGPV